MGTITLTLPIAGTVITAGLLANDMTTIQTVINGGLDSNNWASGKIFAPSKLMQEGATTGQAMVWDGSTWVAKTRATYQATPADPTAQFGDKMLGLAGAITPAVTGSVFVEISCSTRNTSAGVSSYLKLRYGTGGAPANGAAATGTVVGVQRTITSPGVSYDVPVTIGAVITGLTVATAYWLDLSSDRDSGTFTARQVTISAAEV